MIGRATAPGAQQDEEQGTAAMEPASDRPGDPDQLVLLHRQVSVPQWSRPVIGRATYVQHDRIRAGVCAAMEPAGDRPGDLVNPGTDLYIFLPQWSRPVIGRAT